ncbi:MAG: class I SAM-dependent methyltransferase [Thermoguttaceae bacterium]
MPEFACLEAPPQESFDDSIPSDEPLGHVTYDYLGIDPRVLYANKFAVPEIVPTASAGRFDADYARARFLTRHISGGRVLDLGCGSGPYARVLREQCRVATLIGVDMDPACAAAAKRTYDEVLPFECRRRLPFPDGHFDAVFSVDFFGHVEFRHKNALIAEIARVTRCGGISVHAIEAGEVDYQSADPSNPDDPIVRYVRQEGHIGIEPGSKIRHRWQSRFADVRVESSFLFPLAPLGGLEPSLGAQGGTFASILGELGPRERRAASICVGFFGEYLKEAIAGINADLLVPPAAADVVPNLDSAQWLVWRLFHRNGGLVYLTCRQPA